MEKGKGIGYMEGEEQQLAPRPEPLPPPVPINDAHVQRVVNVWLKSISKGSARTYATIIRNFFKTMHLAREVGWSIIVVDGVEYIDWDGVIRADVVKQLNASEIKNYLADRMQHGLVYVRKGHLTRGKPIGIRRANLELSCIKSLAKELFLEEVIRGERMRKIELIKLTKHGKPKEARAVSMADYEGVLESIRPKDRSDLVRALRDRCIIILGFKYWLRKSELQNLRVGSIKSRLIKDNGEIGTAYTLEYVAKGDKPRSIFLTPEVAKTLLIWLKESGLENADEDNYLFPPVYRSGKFRTQPGDPTKVAMNVGMDGAIEQRFDELYREKGLIRPGERSGITLHSLRRGGMQAAKRGGADIVDISWDAGHAEISTTSIYLGQRGFDIKHSSQFIDSHEVSTEDWLEVQKEELKEEWEERDFFGVRLRVKNY